MKQDNRHTASPLISVIVPVYNAEKTLRQCVDSILGQDYRDFELLLIDDGSKDDSPAICDEYARQDERVHVLHKPNGGVSSARNLGLENAHGEWISFVDSDDFLTYGYFDNVDGSVEDLLVRGYKNFKNGHINDDLSVDYIPKGLSLCVFVENYLLNPILRGPVFKFYKRFLLDGISFNTDMKIGEDAHFVYRYLVKCQSYKLLSGGEYVIRISEVPENVKYSITVDYAVKSLSSLKEVFEEVVQIYHIDRGIFLSYIGYFKRISKSDWKNNKSKWYDNRDIQALYKYVWPNLPWIRRFQILGTFITKK